MNLNIISFALIVMLAAAGYSQDYEIRIQRPIKVNDERKLCVTAKQSMNGSITADGAQPSDNEKAVSIQFDGLEKVIAVDQYGTETKAMLTVDKFIKSENGRSSDILPAGTVVICFVADNEEQSYEIGGKPVDDATSQALDMTIRLGRSVPTADDALGTNDRKMKGESWDVNGNSVKKYLENAAGFTESHAIQTTGSPVKIYLGKCRFRNFVGKSKLEDITGDDIKVSANISAEFTAILPDETVYDANTMDANVSVVCPIDTSKYESKYEFSMITYFLGHFERPKGKMIVRMKTELSFSRVITPIK